MSKLEEFYNALVKDPDLDVKAGQTRSQAARQEAEYRARQYENNAKALALAVAADESPINSLLNHVQNLYKSSASILLKAPKEGQSAADWGKENDKKLRAETPWEMSGAKKPGGGKETAADKQAKKISFEDDVNVRDALGNSGFSNEEITNFNNQGILHNKDGQSLSPKEAVKQVNTFVNKNKKPKEFTEAQNKNLQALHERRNTAIDNHKKATEDYNNHKNKTFGPIAQRLQEYGELNSRFTIQARENREKKQGLDKGSLKGLSIAEQERHKVLKLESLGMNKQKPLREKYEEAFRKGEELRTVAEQARQDSDKLDTPDYKEWVRQQTNKTENKPQSSVNKKPKKDKKTVTGVNKKKKTAAKKVTNTTSKKADKVNYGFKEAQDKITGYRDGINKLKSEYPEDWHFGPTNKPEDMSQKDHLNNLYSLEKGNNLMMRADQDFQLSRMLEKGVVPSSLTAKEGSIEERFINALKDKHNMAPSNWHDLKNDAKQKIWNDVSSQIQKDLDAEAKKTDITKDTYIHLLASGMPAGQIEYERTAGELHNKINGNKLSINQLNRKYSGKKIKVSSSGTATEKAKKQYKDSIAAARGETEFEGDIEFNPDYDKETFEPPVVEEKIEEKPAEKKPATKKKSTPKVETKPKKKKTTPKVETKVEEKIEPPMEEPKPEEKPKQSTGDDEKKSQHINNIMNHMFGDDQDSDQAKIMREHLEDSSHDDVASEHKGTVIAGIKQQASQAMKDKTKQQEDSAADEQKLITGDDHEDVTGRQEAARQSKGNQYVTHYDAKTGKYSGSNIDVDPDGKINMIDKAPKEDVEVTTGPPNPEIIPQMFAQGYVWHEETRHWIKKDNLDDQHQNHKGSSATLMNGNHEGVKQQTTFLHPSSTPDNKIKSKGQFLLANGHTHQLGVGTTGKALQHSLSQGGHLNSHNTSGRSMSTFKDFSNHHANAGTNVHTPTPPKSFGSAVKEGRQMVRDARSAPKPPAPTDNSIASKFLSTIGVGFKPKPKPDFEKSLDLHKARVEVLERLKNQV